MKKLAVFFPGRKYSVDCPLLYYSDFLLSVKDYKIKHLNYSKTRDDVSKMDLDREIEENIKFVNDELKGIDFSEYEEIVFIAKSIGTALLIKALKEFKLKKAKLILMTPLEQTLELMKDIEESFFKDSLIIAGDNDNFINFNKIMEFTSNKDIKLIRLNNLGHSLENDDPYESINIVSDIIKEIERFLWGY